MKLLQLEMGKLAADIWGILAKVSYERLMVYHDYYAKTDAPSNIFSSDLET